MVKNNMASPIKKDSQDVTSVVDEAVDGSKAIPFVMVTKDSDGNYKYVESGSGGGDGKSAYDVAVDEGFEGSVEDWLESLRGTKGDPGAPGNQGDPGKPGEPGDNGFGTKEQYDAIIARLDKLEGTED